MNEECAGDLLIVSHYNTIRCIIGKALQLVPQQVVKISIPNAVPIVLRKPAANGRYELLHGLEASW
jgi:bisphosphoglycerate-dependent phosphoglycerate mutase